MLRVIPNFNVSKTYLKLITFSMAVTLRYGHLRIKITDYLQNQIYVEDGLLASSSISKKELLQYDPKHKNTSSMTMKKEYLNFYLMKNQVFGYKGKNQEKRSKSVQYLMLVMLIQNSDKIEGETYNISLLNEIVQSKNRNSKLKSKVRHQSLKRK